MKYAKVIVDVPAKQTDRPFDYILPAELKPWVDIGSRVGVPFGSRTVQGFVVGLSDRADAEEDKLKPILEVLDLHPPLNRELVELARWMSRAYVCSEIAALMAMLPGALKAKYEKYVALAENSADFAANGGEGGYLLADPAQAEIVSFVREKGKVAAETLLRRFPGKGALIRDLFDRGVFVELRSAKDRVSKKTVLTVAPSQPTERLLEAAKRLPAQASRQKKLLIHFADRPEPIRLADLSERLGVGADAVKSLAAKGFVSIQKEEMLRDPYAGRSFAKTSPLPLTDEQRKAYEAIVDAMERRERRVFLLHGVTGSGKTEVYLQAIERCLRDGRQAIVLVPEISLTPQMVERFKGRFGDAVAVLHSRLSPGERYDEWRKIGLKRVQVVIGARSAVFAPFSDLGLIIVDEEHESSYKQEESPKYHAREVAIARAEYHRAVVVLGSATPSLESYARAIRPDTNEIAASAEPGSAPARTATDHGSVPYRLLTLRSRVEGRPLPHVHIVDMRQQLREGNRSMFSRPLHKAIERRLNTGEQTVLLLNRRGYSTFVMCRSCGHVIQCPHCDISLTYHRVSRAMRCHYCGVAEPEPNLCPNCGSEHIRYFGTGTQRVEEELAKLFPGIRVIRMDVDTTAEKGAHEKLLNRFRNKQADVLLGTQMVAKGLDFPDVTLVGVIAADTMLHLPDFRAAEKTFQLLTQVAGRAGRHRLPGEVFIQTYSPDHYSIVHAGRHDYESFVREELTMRRSRGYPPFCRLVLVTFAHEEAGLLVRVGESFAAKLKERWNRERGAALSPEASGERMEVLGPVASPIPRIKDRYRFQCMIKYRGETDVPGLVGEVAASFDELARKENMQISVDVNPQMLL